MATRMKISCPNQCFFDVRGLHANPSIHPFIHPGGNNDADGFSPGIAQEKHESSNGDTSPLPSCGGPRAYRRWCSRWRACRRSQHRHRSRSHFPEDNANVQNQSWTWILSLPSDANDSIKLKTIPRMTNAFPSCCTTANGDSDLCPKKSFIERRVQYWEDLWSA